jgi:hypothetical protein
MAESLTIFWAGDNKGISMIISTIKIFIFIFPEKLPAKIQIRPSQLVALG